MLEWKLVPYSVPTYVACVLYVFVFVYPQHTRIALLWMLALTSMGNTRTEHHTDTGGVGKMFNILVHVLRPVSSTQWEGMVLWHNCQK